MLVNNRISNLSNNSGQEWKLHQLWPHSPGDFLSCVAADWYNKKFASQQRKHWDISQPLLSWVFQWRFVNKMDDDAEGEGYEVAGLGIFSVRYLLLEECIAGVCHCWVIQWYCWGIQLIISFIQMPNIVVCYICFIFIIFVYFYLLFDWDCNEVPGGPILYIWIFSKEFSFYIDKMDKS